MSLRRNGMLLAALGMMLALVLAACGSDEAPAAPAAPKAAAPAAAAAAAPKAAAPKAADSAAAPKAAAPKAASKFAALVAEAKKGNGVARAPLGFHSDAAVAGLEAAFEERFGFQLKLETEPGHPVRDMPTKITTAAKNQKGVIDTMLWGNSAVTFPVLEQGFMRKPNWEAVLEEWPGLEELRMMTPAWKTTSGENLQDYCALAYHGTWVWNYNPRNVTAEEVKNLTTTDLIGPTWKNRVVADERALGFYYFPLAKGWSEERLTAWTHNLGANGLKLFPGGSRGVHQALLQGEGDIGLGSPARDKKQLGQPIDFVVAEFTTGANPNISCLPKYGVSGNNPALGELVWAWDIMEGRRAISRPPIHYASAGFLLENVKDDYPLMKELWAKGLRLENLVYSRTQADGAKVGGWRKIAMDGQKAGINSKKPVPYPYK